MRNETFDVAPRWGAPVVFRLDRGAVPFFGTRAYGVHLNGYLRNGAPSIYGSAGAPPTSGSRPTSSTTSSPAASATDTGCRKPC